MRHLRQWCLVVALFPSAALAAEPVWRNLGPGGGGWIQSICASPHDAAELFVGCDVGGFYRSGDGGQSYRIHNSGLRDYWVECIAPHPADPNVIYLGCESGVYKSTDRGRTWQWLRQGFPPKSRYSWSAPIGALVIDPRAADTLYAGIGRPRRYTFGKGAVYKTTDAGGHWARINAPDSLPQDAWVTDLLIRPDDSKRLYLACQHGVYQSRDAGVTWERTISGLPHPHVRRVALCRQQPNVLYLTLRSEPGKRPWQGGVYKSVDAGKVWSPCLEGLKQHVGKPGQPGPLTSNYDRLAVHPGNPDVVYVGGDAWVTATIYKTTDGGKTWADVVRRRDDVNIDMGWITMWGPTVKCLAMSPINPEALYFGTSGMVFKTTDAGGHWTQAYTRVLPDGRFQTTGLEVTCIHNLVLHPRDPKRLYFGYGDIGLLVSEDAGESFRRCVEGIEPRALRNTCFDVVFDPDAADHCWGSFGAWASNQGVVAESNDAGRTWRPLGTPEHGLPNARHRTLLLDPSSPAGARRLVATADEHGVYVSEDGGRTWQARNAGLPHGNIRALVQHPKQPAAYWCVLGAKAEQLAAVFRSDDQCRSWRQVSRNFEATDVKRLVVAASDPQRLYLAARDAWLARKRVVKGGLFRSDDGGENWRKVLEDDFVQGLAVDPRDADLVYAGLHDHPFHDESTGDGIVVTHDGGKTWASLNGTGLTCKQVVHIVVDPHDPDRLYIGTGGNSVFVGRVSQGALRK